jgi:hypothetical protein
MLLDAGADVNATMAALCRPLLLLLLPGAMHATASPLKRLSRCCWTLVLTLTSGPGGYYGCALQAAVAAADAGCKIIDEDDSDYKLYHGSDYDSNPPTIKEIIQMLIDAGADVSAGGGIYGSALRSFLDDEEDDGEDEDNDDD